MISKKHQEDEGSNDKALSYGNFVVFQKFHLIADLTDRAKASKSTGLFTSKTIVCFANLGESNKFGRSHKFV